MITSSILENFRLLFVQPDNHPGFFEFLLLTFAGWIMYLVIDFGVVSKSAPHIGFKDTISLYWKINFAEIIVSFILIFVLSYLYMAGSLDEFLTLIRLNVKFTSNTEIKALLLGFYLKLISALIRKFTSPIKIQVEGNSALKNDGYTADRLKPKKKMSFKNKS